MSSSFVVVVCHGSYHIPELYVPFLNSLKERGIEAHCPQLPTSDLSKLNVGDVSNPDFDRDAPPGGYPQPVDDVKVIKTLLKQFIVEDGKNVILVGHSSGGFVATASATSDLQAKIREAQGRPGGIIGLFYACAFVVPVGESIHSTVQPKDGSPPYVPPWCKFHVRFTSRSQTLLLNTTVASKEEWRIRSHHYRRHCKVFLHGLDEEKAKYYENMMTASPILRTVLESDAYSALPCVYVVTENDIGVPTSAQEGVVGLQNMREGVDIKVVRCQAGHSPFLTWTEGLVREVQKFGKELAG